MTIHRRFNLISFYSSTLRLSLLDKFLAHNLYLIPDISAGILSVQLKDLSDFDDSRLIAAVFILRLLSGGKPYISRFGLFQTFYTRNYDSVVEVRIGRHASYSLVALLAERVLPFLAKADFRINIQKKKNGTLVTMTIADLSFIRVVETHSVFFRWHDKVRICFTVLNANSSETAVFLSGLKLCISWLLVKKEEIYSY